MSYAEVITANQKKGGLTSIVAISILRKVTFKKYQEKRIQLVKNFVDEHNEEFAYILETGYSWVPKTLSKCNEDCFNTIEGVINKLCDERRLGITNQKTSDKYLERKQEFEEWVATTDYKEKLAVINSEYDEEAKHFKELFSEIVADPFFDEACKRYEDLQKEIEEIQNQAESFFKENKKKIPIEEACERVGELVKEIATQVSRFLQENEGMSIEEACKKLEELRKEISNQAERFLCAPSL